MSELVCKKICKECIFSTESTKGFLGDYTIDDFIKFKNNDIYFPCHMLLTDKDLTTEETKEFIIKGKLKLCSGYIDMLKKSHHLPKDEILNTIVKSTTSDDKTMNFIDFIKHHDIFNEYKK